MNQKILTNEEIGSVCMALSHLLHSGISLADALVLLGEDTQDADLGNVLRSMAEGMDAGATAARVFREAERFPEYVTTLIGVGEQVGKLESALHALAEYYQNRAKLERQLRSALVYPVVLMAVLLAVMTGLLVWVLPVFDQVYAQLGSSLTGLAGWLLALGMGIKKLLPVLLAVGLLLVVLLMIPAVRKNVSRFMRNRLGDRGVYGKINRARFIQALSMGISSGMAPREAAEMASTLAQTRAFRNDCDRCMENLAGGSSLAKALKQTGMLTQAQGRLLEAGERSGRLDQVLEHLSGQLLTDSEEELERQAGKVEPVMVIVACVLIGGVLLAVLLPLIHIMSAIG